MSVSVKVVTGYRRITGLHNIYRIVETWFWFYLNHNSICLYKHSVVLTCFFVTECFKKLFSRTRLYFTRHFTSHVEAWSVLRFHWSGNRMETVTIVKQIQKSDSPKNSEGDLQIMCYCIITHYFEVFWGLFYVLYTTDILKCHHYHCCCQE